MSGAGKSDRHYSDLTAKLYSYQNLCIVCYTEIFQGNILGVKYSAG